MLAVDGVASVITWSPYMILAMVIATLPADKSGPASANLAIYRISFFTVALSNCFTTPVIYLIFNKNFKVTRRVCIVFLDSSGLLNSYKTE